MKCFGHYGDGPSCGSCDREADCLEETEGREREQEEREDAEERLNAEFGIKRPRH